MLAVLALLLVATSNTGAAARDGRCYGLEDELARLSSMADDRRDGAEVRQWDNALQDASRELDGLERRYRRARCNGGGFLFSSPDPRICGGIERDIADVRARMAQFSRNRAIAMRRSGGGDTARRIAAVRAQLQRLDCSAPEYRASSRPEDPRYPQDPSRYGSRPNRNGVIDERGAGSRARPDGLFGMLFGGGRRYERDDYPPEDRGYGYGGDGGTYRTLCVRRCDGFFFPISFSTTEDQFAHDAEQCQSMCPGTSAELFVYRNPGENPSDMVSLDGTPYKDMENAFRYRTEYDADCSCKTANMSIAASGSVYDGNMTPLTASGSGTALNSSADEPWDPDRQWQPLDTGNGEESWDPNDPWDGYRAADDRLVTDVRPIPKLAADADPDTVLNARGGFVPKLAAIDAGTAADAPEAAVKPAEPSRVRRVGPKYFVAQ